MRRGTEGVRKIVERAVRGDHEAFGMLLVRTSAGCMRSLTRNLRDTDLAEDALRAVTRLTDGPWRRPWRGVRDVISDIMMS